MTNYLSYKDNFAKIRSINSKLVYGDLNFNKNPTVTIAIPTYKRQDLLKEAIESALNQKDYTDYEVIVVDNDPNPDTETEYLIRSYNNPKLLYYKNEQNLGMIGNWNRCLELARGKWYSMLHDDDLLSNVFLKEMFTVLNKYPKISFLYSGHYTLDERNLPNKNNAYFLKLRLKRIVTSFAKKIRKLSEWDYFLTVPIPPVGVIMKKENAINLGGFGEDTSQASDHLLFTRYCINYNTYSYNKKLCSYRFSENLSFQNGNIITSAGIVYDIAQELKNRSIFRKIFFKKYPDYFYSMFIKHIENYYQVSVKKNEVKFSEKNVKLNFFDMLFGNFIFTTWMLKNILI